MDKKISFFIMLALISIKCSSSELSTLAFFEHCTLQLGYDSSNEEGGSDNQPNRDFDYQLILAIAQKKYDLDFIDQLLFDGADPNYQHVMYSPISHRHFLAAPGQLAGMTPLGILSREATFTQEMKKIADLLIDYGAHINKSCAALYPPLGFAIKNRNFDFAHYALDNEANPHKIKTIEYMIADLQKVSWRDPDKTHKLIVRLRALMLKDPIERPKASYIIECESHTPTMTTVDNRFGTTAENLSDRAPSDEWTFAEKNHAIKPIPQYPPSLSTGIHPDYMIHSLSTKDGYSPLVIKRFNSFSQAMINYVDNPH